MSCVVSTEIMNRNRIHRLQSLTGFNQSPRFPPCEREPFPISQPGLLSAAFSVAGDRAGVNTVLSFGFLFHYQG